MGRPTIALCLIVKNEKENLPRLFESVRGCFDEWHVVDTGSTDGTIELLTEAHRKNTYGTPLFLHYFDWVNDFAAARNFSFAQATTDYIAWLDADDVLDSARSFTEWRDSVLPIADYWVATYHYALNGDGNPVCSFARERIVKRSLGLEWKYFVHEGIPGVQKDGKPLVAQYATTWSVRHMRTEKDIKADRSRNLRLFQDRVDSLDSRMQYYYGKELFENDQPKEAFEWLLKAAKKDDLELHDRVLAIQYGAMAATKLSDFDKAIQMAHAGLQVSPNRAEFFVMIGDAYLKKSQLAEAIPYYQAAQACSVAAKDSPIRAPIYQHEESYNVYPRNQIARIYFHLGDIEKSMSVLVETQKTHPNPETVKVIAELSKVASKVSLISSDALIKTDDIVISCMPGGLYEWDEESYKEKGIGGSETAAVEMARHLHKLTGRTVRIFNHREKAKGIDGVEYAPIGDVYDYMRTRLPQLHIAWRHNQKVTQAETLIWNHDLGFPGLQAHENYKYVLCLSDFHKSFVRSTFGIPEEKIIVTRNGIDPDRFKGLDLTKTPGSVVWSSSPDRGLNRAIKVLDLVKKDIPETNLHIFYGFDNMRKIGKMAEIKELETLIADRPWITYHGNVEQRELAQKLGKIKVWLYPTNFLETFAISALEMLACNVIPVVRAWGALPNTLASAKKAGLALILDRDCETKEDIDAYAEATRCALQDIQVSGTASDLYLSKLSWESVAREWVELFNLSR